MKKILTALIVIALLITALVLASCEKEHVHSFKDTVVKPTCTFKGYTEHVCTDCGYAFQDTFVDVNPSNHVYGEEIIDKPATCSATGSKHKDCVQCGKVLTTTIKKTAHSNIEEVLVAATCTEKGTKQLTCRICGTVSTASINAKGHSYGDWIVDLEAVCETETHGLKHHVCTECDFVEEAVILPHTANGKGTVTAPTCVSVGYTTYECADCGASYVRDHKPALTNKDGSPKHTFGNWTKVEGYDNLERRDCKYCDHYEVRETK